MTGPVLVAYGTKRGATAEIAEEIADVVRSKGVEVDVKPVGSVSDIDRYGAVIVGSAIYMGRWIRAVVRFLRRYRWELKQRPVWFFHDGPLGDDRAAVAQPLPRKVQDIGDRIGVRGTVTFGGRLDAHPHGLVAQRMATRYAGDFRDHDEIRAWADHVGTEIAARP